MQVGGVIYSNNPLQSLLLLYIKKTIRPRSGQELFIIYNNFAETYGNKFLLGLSNCISF